MKIQYRIGDATRPQYAGPKVIAHICNDRGAWGAGFVMALSRRWTEPANAYLSTPEFLPGTTQVVHVGRDQDDGYNLFVANMIAQIGIGPTRHVNYGDLRRCLGKLQIWLDVHREPLCPVKYPMTVHMPRIGCGLGRGDWKLVSQAIEDTLDVPVFVYDLTEEDARKYNG